MTTETELDVMLIKQISDVDDATKRAHKLDDNVWSTLEEMARDWAEKRGWSHVCGDGEISIAPPHWYPDEQWKRWWQFTSGHGDNESNADGEDFYFITRLCNKGRGMYGFRFYQQEVGRRPMKSASLSLVNSFTETGFSLDDGANYFHPFSASADELAEAVGAGDIESGLGGFTELLDRTFTDELVAKFDALMERAKSIEQEKKA